MNNNDIFVPLYLRFAHLQDVEALHDRALDSFQVANEDHFVPPPADGPDYDQTLAAEAVVARYWFEHPGQDGLGLLDQLLEWANARRSPENRMDNNFIDDAKQRVLVGVIGLVTAIMGRGEPGDNGYVPSVLTKFELGWYIS